MENFVMRKVNREEKRIKAATKDWRLNINVLSSSHCNRLHRIHAKERKKRSDCTTKIHWYPAHSV